MFHLSRNFRIENAKLFECGFNSSEIIDLRIFTNIQPMLKNFEVQNGVITIGGFTIQKLRDTINERQFVLKMYPVVKLHYDIRYLGFTFKELNDIRKYIRIPKEWGDYIDISTKGFCDNEWLMFGFNANEIRQALLEYYERESYYNPSKRFTDKLDDIPMYTDLLKIHREKENT